MSSQKTEKLNVSALLKAIEIAGNMRNLCTQLGVSYQSILDWKSERRAPSPFNCLKIERVTNGKVKKEDILPNYPWGQTKTAEKNDDKLEAAKKLLISGIDIEIISNATGISIEEIEKLEKKDEKLEIAKKMLGMGMSKENISEATGVSMEELEKIQM